MSRSTKPLRSEGPSQRTGSPIARVGILLCVVVGAANAGCVTFQTGVASPSPHLSRVAVAPFFNLSSEPATEGRKIAEIYAGELQKTPGFEVVPVGVTEMALREHKLELTSPADAVKLAEILGVDAVVVGAVTENEPYHPPRLGLRTAWYAPNSPELAHLPTRPVYPPPLRDRILERVLSIPIPVIPLPWVSDDPDAYRREQCDPPPIATPIPPIVRGQNPPLPQPLMTYARVFDGRDAVTTAQLRDYVELSGDERAGGWRAYLLCTSDFVRFCCHRMVHEMLTLHGGQDRIRAVYGFRKQK